MRDSTTTSSDRLKAASILYSLEAALGRIVRNRGLTLTDVPAMLIDTIRNASRNEFPDPLTIESLVENSYLAEAFQLALTASRGTDAASAIAEIQKWCEGAGIFPLRNTVAHPNRRWHDHYWHLTEALATHPAVIAAGLREVVEAHKAAIEGTFQPPPNSWLNAVLDFEIPHNLDRVRRQHGLTAFYGRSREKQALRKYLANDRVSVIALVGIGGLGKTALVVDCLQDLARDPAAGVSIKRIVFISGKTVITGIDGERLLTPDFRSVADVSESIARVLLESPSGTLDEAIAVYGDERLVICLDNVEGVIIDNATLIDELVLSLPVLWKVILTSRIPVNSAVTVQLERMSEPDARALIYGYSRELGRPGSITENQVSQVAAKAETPLAIRLTVEGVVGGAPLPSALLDAQKITSENAYQQLLDALSPDARLLIEAIHAAGEPLSPVSMGLLLSWDLSRTQEALAQLRRFNLLVTVDEDAALVTLRDSLHDHLIASPIDLRARNESHRQWQRLKGDLQVTTPTEEQDVGELGDVRDRLLRVTLHKVLSRVRDAESAEEVMDEVERLATLHPRSSAVRRVLAKLFRYQGNEVALLRELEAALTLDPFDWRSAELLGIRYRNSRRYEDAARVVAPCVQKYCGPDSTIDLRSQIRLTQLLQTTRIWHASDILAEGDVARGTAALEDLVEATRYTTAPRGLEVTMAGLHAMALRRLTQSPAIPPSRKFELLTQALDVYEDIFSRHGPQFFVVMELAELVGELIWRAGHRESSPSQLHYQKLADFLGTHLDALMSVTNSRDAAARAKLFTAVQALMAHENGSYVRGTRLEQWGQQQSYSKLTPDNVTDGYVVATVYAASNGRPFLFAIDAAGQQYFVSSRFLSDPADSIESWPPGTEITGLVGGRSTDGKAIPLIDVRRI